jgi:hypothetical protein
MVGSWNYIGGFGEKINSGDCANSRAPADKQFRSTTMVAGRIRAPGQRPTIMRNDRFDLIAAKRAEPNVLSPRLSAEKL